MSGVRRSAVSKRETLRCTAEGKPFRMVLLRPASFKRAVIVANGAGASMDSEFITYFHEELARCGFLAVKFNFPYQEGRRSGPDRALILEATYLAVIERLKEETGLSPGAIVGGGKSMGGRIGSMIAGRAGLKRLFFLGYPLHPPGRPERLRDEHLYGLDARLLFVSGTRDPLCQGELLEAVVARLKHAEVMRIPDGDHSFKVPKRSGLTLADVRESVKSAIVRFAR